MYPNYTKAFLNLEGVSIKKVVQADSFIKIFIQSQPVEQTCPCCGAKTKRIHDYRLQEVQDIPLQGNQVSCLRLTSFPLPLLPLTDEFKGNASTGKYQCILVDPKKRRILDILPDRTQSHLADYWRNIPRKERLKVKFFVCDMWRPYTELAQTFFPNATIIVDKYHFIRQVTWAIENVRKRLQRSMPVSLRKYYKRSRKLILTRYKKAEG